MTELYDRSFKVFVDINDDKMVKNAAAMGRNLFCIGFFLRMAIVH